jgi:PAP2 superfamily
MRRRRIGTAALGLFPVLALSVWAAPATTHADPFVARDPAVIVRWNAITERTLAENAVPIPPSGLYYAFSALAMYDAVVTIEGRFEPWSPQPRAHAHASPQVAAATAAYNVLRHYFPNSAAALAADYTAELSEVPEGVGKVHGIRVGEAAAATLIARRANDGRGANVPQPGAPPLESGEWRPTAQAFAPMLAPWLGFVTPLVLPSPTAIPLEGPPALDSAVYATEFAEVRDYGRSDSALRSPEQTATALFWNANSVRQYQIAMRDQVTDRQLDIVDTARTFAVLDASTADAAIACWRAKYDFNFWRPDTAIALAADDNNPATQVVPGWTPLIPNPPYPDYTSGHACITGAATGTLKTLFDSPLSPAFDVPSLAATSNRQFTDTSALDAETMNARIWLGIHFRTAMTDGNALGHAVAETVASHLHPTTS